MSKVRMLVGLGCCCSLALGIYWPQSAPAQTAEKKAGGTGIIFQLDGKQPRFIVVQDRSPDQELIDLLQRALQILSKKGQGQAGKGDAALQRARADVEALRAQKEQVEARLRQAQARLAELQGKPLKGKMGAGGLQIQLEFQPDGKSPKKGIEFLKGLELRLQDGRIIGLPAGKDKQPSTEDLQNRLNRLMREIEELRRDIQRKGPAKK
jgi:hypothetical protein